jgi:hypothetical protein
VHQHHVVAGLDPLDVGHRQRNDAPTVPDEQPLQPIRTEDLAPPLHRRAAAREEDRARTLQRPGEALCPERLQEVVERT